ncbi:MAG: hypothetical protein VCC04_09910, partial [Myxococcota bacterium]
LDELVGKVTQFATTEYPPDPDAAPNASPAAGESQLTDLERRVATLEAQLNALQPNAQSAGNPTSP